MQFWSCRVRILCTYGLCLCMGLWFTGCWLCSPLFADEPYQRFLQRLKDEQLFDLALVYLDELKDQPNIDRRFLSNVELERGLLLYQSAASLPTSNPLRNTKLDEAEDALRAFLSSQNRHPRRTEARLKIGELLLQRAEEAKSKAGADATQDRPEAIRFYGEAHELFESTVQELAGILDEIKGARTDPNDPEAVAYRQSIQQQIRQAQMLSAKALEDRGKSRSTNSPERTADLRQALQMFGDLYSKEQRMVAVRNLALFYRSAIQEELGMQNEAIDGFLRIADLDGLDELRPLQTDALARLIQLLGREGKYSLAVDRADQWIKNLRPDEIERAETLALKLELSKLRLAWADQLKKENPEDRVASRLVRAARDDLRNLLRVQGPHADETRELLAQLGVESTTEPSQELPKVSSFADAIMEAQKRLDQSENDALGLAVLRQQGQLKESEELEAAISLQREQAISLFREAIRLYSSSDEMTQLDQARFSLAYLELKQQRAWEAVGIAEFLSRKNPKTDQGLRAAAITLAGLSDLLRASGSDEKLQLTAQLEPFAAYLVETWPEAEETSAAVSALVQLALLNEQWDKVEQYLALAPTGGEKAAKLHRVAGLSFFSRYFQQKQQDGEESQASKQLKARAIDSLTIACSNLNQDQLDSETIEASNALARLLLTEGKLQEASKQLIEQATSPLKVLAERPDLASPKVAMNSYRTAIQLIIGQMAEATIEPQQAISQTADYIQTMQSLAEKTPDGSSLLAGIFVSLARDLKDQLEQTSDPEKRRRLSEAMLILGREAAKSESFSTQYWAAETLISIAEELAANRGSRQTAMQAFGNASDILKQIIASETQQPGFVQPEGFLVKIRLMLAKASRGLGDFKSAINELAAILQENNALLDVQTEAARTYQAWGDAVNPGFHKVAYLGGRPDPKTRNNLIWGWGKIARVVEGKQDYQEQFYSARYELARSRFKSAAAAQNPQAQQEIYARAAKDITSTATLYPELGGNAMKKKYDALLKQIQKALGQNPTGLAGLQNPNN